MQETFNIVAGATSIRLQIRLLDSSVSYAKGKTGLLFSTGSLKAYYFRDGATAAVAVTLVTSTIGTWVSGGFREIDATNLPGLYELDIPDTALATGAKWVKVIISGAAGMADLEIVINLVGNDPFSAQASSAFNAAVATAVGALAIETGVSLKQILEAIGAATAGNYDDATKTFKAVSNSGTSRITTAISGANRTNTPSL